MSLDVGRLLLFELGQVCISFCGFRLGLCKSNIYPATMEEIKT